MVRTRQKGLAPHPAFIGRSLLVLALCTWQSTNAQTHKIDSLKKIVSAAKEGDQKMNAIMALCEESISMNIDTFYHYSTLAKEMAEKEGNQKKKYARMFFWKHGWRVKTFLTAR